jgi:exodeoxyribonuclease X
MTARYYLLDTETSGLPPGAGVCEIGWHELAEDASIIRTVTGLTDPEFPISPSASGVHTITDDDVEGCPTLAEFFSESDEQCYGEPLRGDPVVLVGHRVSFDRQFVEPYTSGPIREVCTLRWLRSLYPHMDDHKLSTAKYALGLRRDAGAAHRVLADIDVTYDLLLHILQRLDCSLSELVERSQEPMLLAFMPFGKHKGEPFAEVPKSYLRWADGNLKDLDMDLAHTIKFYLYN